jgi:hypothetical protein
MVLFSMGMGFSSSGRSPPVSLEIGPALGTALRKLGMARLKKAYSGGVWLANAVGMATQFRNRTTLFYPVKVILAKR